MLKKFFATTLLVSALAFAPAIAQAGIIHHHHHHHHVVHHHHHHY
ncbi:MAG: hypothetical protein WCF20_08710 [Methylovirgula sp.]